MRKKLFVSTIIFTLFMYIDLFAALGRITGTITDSSSGESLPGANIQIKGSPIGAATDINGIYSITQVPPGPQTIIISYIGYDTKSLDIVVPVTGKTVVKDIQLTFKVLEGQVVEVSAQREGQVAAINQQVNAATIKNVVSQERIQELPDENAAESVGRLPGVAVRRSGGEGSRVIIRGLSPKFSAVTVNGERIPATGQGRSVFSVRTGANVGADPNVDDRSVDLSMISSEALGGIELIKAPTPDKDADAIGGTVNFVTKKVKPGWHTRLNILGAYIGYHESMENIKGNASISNRFFDDKLGVLLSTGYQRADRSSDEQEVTYTYKGKVEISHLDLDDKIEKRDRINANLNMDYQMGNTDIAYSSMYARTNRDIMNRSLDLSINSNSGNYSASWSKPSIYFYNHNLKMTHWTNLGTIDWSVNQNATIDENDFNYGYGFFDAAPFRQSNFLEEKGALYASKAASIDSNSYMRNAPWGGGKTARKDKNWVAQLNFKRNFNVGQKLSGYLKMGAKYRSKNRTFKSTGLKSKTDLFLSRLAKDNPDIKLVHGLYPSMTNYVNAYDAEPFFNGDHQFPITLDAKMPYTMFKTYENIWKPRIADGLNNYTAFETVSASYVMTELDYNNRITFLGGVRYEHSDSDYQAVYRWDVHEDYDATSPNDIKGFYQDTTSTQTYSKFLPMMHLKFSLLKDTFSSNGIDLKLAATQTLSRPDYRNLTPSTNINNSGFLLERGNPTLKPTDAINYDAFLTGYHNQLGLLTIGAFYKELTNVDYMFAHEAVAEQDSEQWSGFTIVEPKNSEHLTRVWGTEVEVQTNLSFLPSPFDGVIIYGNVSDIKSEAFFPYNLKEFNPKTFRVTKIDTTRKGRLPGQANRIINASIGYEKGRFSGRISYYFQGKALDWIGENAEMDGWIDDYARIDLSASIKFTKNITWLLNVNNLLNRHDRTFVGINNLVNSETIYGFRAESGLRFLF